MNGKHNTDEKRETSIDFLSRDATSVDFSCIHWLVCKSTSLQISHYKGQILCFQMNHCSLVVYNDAHSSGEASLLRR